MSFLRRLALQEKNNLMTARVSMLLESRSSLTCFRACFSPGRAKDLSAPRVLLLLLLTAIELSLGGSSPYTSTDKTNKNKYT